MTTIYDNAEHQGFGYSGVLLYEFQYHGFYFSINKGSTNSRSEKPAVKAYHITVNTKITRLFSLYAYQDVFVLNTDKGMLYLSLETMMPQGKPIGNEDQIANFIFATACRHTNTVDFFKYALDAVYLSALAEGKYQVQTDVKKALGIF